MIREAAAHFQPPARNPEATREPTDTRTHAHTPPAAAASTRPDDDSKYDWPPPPESRQNRSKVPLDELMKWVGKHVAWNWEGTQIVAGADTWEGVEQELRRLGVNPRHVVFDYVDDPEVSWL